MRISARYTGPISCPHCGGTVLRDKGRYLRRVRHEDWGERRCVLELEGRKFRCLSCGKHFRQRLAGILPCQRASEAFQKTIFLDHLDGISRRRLGQREGIGSATVERWFQDFLQRLAAERSGAPCPQVLGIDEHFFTRRHGYATTFCDLRGHRVFDVVLGRSQASLESYLERLEGKHRVRLVGMDLSSAYRAIARKHFPNARIVAGSGPVSVAFYPNTPGAPIAGILSVDEGAFVNGRWVPGRKLNGDENGQGRHLQLGGGMSRNGPIQRVKLYRYL